MQIGTAAKISIRINWSIPISESIKYILVLH